MAESSLSVKITADVADLQAKLALAQSSMRTFNSEMKDLANQITSGASATGTLEPQLEAAAAGFAQARAQAAALRAEMSGLGETGEAATTTLGGLQGAFLNFSAIRAGFEIVKSAATDVFETMKQGAEDIDHLSFSLGITNQAANTLDAGLHIVGISTEDYLQTITRLERQMRTNEAAFNTLGVATRDANGQFLNGQQLMQSAVTALDRYKEGTDRQLAATVIFGRSLSQVYSLHLLNNQVMQEGADILDRYGLATDEEGIQKSRMFSQEMNSLDLIADKLIEKFGLDLVTAFGGFGGSLDTVVTMAKQLESDLVAIVQEVVGWVQELKGFNDQLQPIADFLNKIANPGGGNVEFLSRMYNEAAQHLEDLKNNQFTILERLNPWFDKQHAINDLLVQTRDLIAQIAAANAGAPGGQGAGTPQAAPPHSLMDTGGTESFSQPASAGSTARVTQWENDLRQQIQDQIGFFRDSTALEVSYWRNILDTEKLTAKEREDVQRALFEAEKKQAQDGLAEYIAGIKAKQQADKDDFAAKMALENQLLAVLAQDYGTDSKQYQAELRNQEAMQEAHNQKIEAAEERHQAVMKAVADRTAKVQSDSWTQAFDVIDRSFDTMLTGILQGTQTFNQAIGRMLGNLIIAFAEADVKRLLHWVGTEIAMTEASVEGSAAREAASSISGEAGKADHIAGALSSIGTDAAKAYAAVFAWAAPMLGPFAAVPAAAAFALVLGAEALLPSAAGGWVLPSDSLVSAHKGEMILPADLSAGIQRLVGSGNTGGGPQVAFSVNAIDARSVKQLFEDNGREFAAIIGRQLRDNPSVRVDY